VTPVAEELRAREVMARAFVSVAPEDTLEAAEKPPVGVLGLRAVIGTLRPGSGW
jgi:hypothetical protein